MQVAYMEMLKAKGLELYAAYGMLHALHPCC